MIRLFIPQILANTKSQYFFPPRAGLSAHHWMLSTFNTRDDFLKSDSYRQKQLNKNNKVKKNKCIKDV